jgi:hypothetical protein
MIDRIDSQGSLGAFAAGEAVGEGELVGTGDVCPDAAPVIRTAMQAA